MSRLEEQVGQLLMQQALTLATAESCTGGLVSHRLTNVAGSSAYLMGGIIAYSYEAKMQLLQVPEEMLLTQGAVSAQVAVQMALGAKNAFSTDLAISVTGIAGPGGGTPDKPVGLTYIALATENDVQPHRYVWTKDREGNKNSSADAALQLILDYLTRK